MATPEPADELERGLLVSAEDVDDAPLLLQSRSPSPSPVSGAQGKRPPSSMGSGSDLSIELTVPLPADGRSSRCRCIPILFRSMRQAELNDPCPARCCWPRPAGAVLSKLLCCDGRSKPRALSPVQSFSDGSERGRPQDLELGIPKSPSAPNMSPSHCPASPFAAHCTRPFERGASAEESAAAIAAVAASLPTHDSSPAELDRPQTPPAELHVRTSADRRRQRRASVPLAPSSESARQVRGLQPRACSGSCHSLYASHLSQQSPAET